MSGHTWRPIEDLPDTWRDMASEELASLAPIWRERQSELRGNSEELENFNDKLRREWAIETGIIENLYSIDRGTTQLLIEKGIAASLISHGSTNKPREQVVRLLKDQEDTLEGIFQFVSGGRPLSVSYIKELHAALTRNQPETEAVDSQGKSVRIEHLRGEWKKHPNNPTRPDGEIHEYCPPVHVASEMDRLVAMHRTHLEEDVSPEVEAAWLHHRFTQIHPFQDGNGRVARALASAVLIRAEWFPLVISRDVRDKYILALEAADGGNLSELTAIFIKVQKDAFIKALSIFEGIRQEQATLQQLIESAGERLKSRKEAKFHERQKVFEVSTRMDRLAQERLQSVSKQLEVELKLIDGEYFARVDTHHFRPETDHWFRTQIISVAKKLNYFADPNTYRAWVRLKIKEERQTELIISFHSLGVEFLGVMAVSAFLEHRERDENKETTVDGPYAICDEVFPFAYNESSDAVTRRFEPWLSQVILNGLEQWRRQL